MSQICTCHDSWAVVTCAKLWHDHIHLFVMYDLHIFVLEDYELIDRLCDVSPDLVIYRWAEMTDCDWCLTLANKSAVPCQQAKDSGSWFNIKMTSYQYRKSQCGDKTVVRSSYLHNGISYTGKMSSLYWTSPLGVLDFWIPLDNYLDWNRVNIAL